LLILIAGRPATNVREETERLNAPPEASAGEKLVIYDWSDYVDQSGSTTDTSSVDSGCRVDWSWLEGREIASATSDLEKLVITFRDGQTLKVQASVWKGQAFLAFDPWKSSE